MSALFTSPRTRPATRFSRPRLEILEDRAVPANLTLNVGSISGNHVTLSGTLSGAADVAFETIRLGGTVNATTGTNSQGQFTASLSVDDDGGITATTPVDSEVVAVAMIGTEAPVLTSFDAIEGTSSCWTFSGTVTYVRPFESMTILLGGVPVTIQGKTATADSDGEFELTLMLNGYDSDNGTVWAKAISPFGVYSNMLMDSVHQTGT
jgi:hypothetical protein